MKYLRDEGMGKSSLESRVIEEANKFCQYFIEPHLDKEIDIREYQKLATSNVIFSMIFGKRFDYADEQLLENNRMMEVLFDSNLMATLTKNLPLAKWWPGDPFQQNLNIQCLGSTMRYFDEIVSQRRKEMALQSNSRLFVDNYLLDFAEQGEDNLQDLGILMCAINILNVESFRVLVYLPSKQDLLRCKRLDR